MANFLLVGARARSRYTRSAVALLLSKMERVGSCWMWTGYIKPGPRGGYGYVRTKRGGKWRTEPAHRAVYRRYRGAIRGKLTLDHLCRNRACVNPYHLEAVPLKVNILRGTSFGAVNAAKSHCVRGHKLGGANAYVRPGRPGTRDCRACAQHHSRVNYAARKAAANG